MEIILFGLDILQVELMIKSISEEVHKTYMHHQNYMHCKPLNLEHHNKELMMLLMPKTK